MRGPHGSIAEAQHGGPPAAGQHPFRVPHGAICRGTAWRSTSSRAAPLQSSARIQGHTGAICRGTAVEVHGQQGPAAPQPRTTGHIVRESLHGPALTVGSGCCFDCCVLSFLRSRRLDLQTTRQSCACQAPFLDRLTRERFMGQVGGGAEL